MEPTIESAKKYIEEIDFTPLIDKMVLYLGWMRKDAEDTAHYYRNFLLLAKKARHGHFNDAPETLKSIPASYDVDEFWHMHILDTRKYIEDCNAIFGTYLHHYPYLGIDGKSTLADSAEAFEDMQKSHFAEFGEIVPATRSRFHPAIYSVLKTLKRN